MLKIKIACGLTEQVKFKSKFLIALPRNVIFIKFVY